MKSRFLIYTLFSVATIASFEAKAQQTLKIGTNPTTVASSAVLDVEADNKGILIPRISLLSNTDVATIGTPANSLTVFNTNTAIGVTPGYYYWSGPASKWVRLLSGDDPQNGWGLSGNPGTGTTNFLGTTDSQALRFRVNNFLAGFLSPTNSNTFMGPFAGTLSPTGAAGDDDPAALNTPNTSGTAALRKNKTVGIGYQTLASATSVEQSVAIGAFALGKSTSSRRDVAIGFKSGYQSQTFFGSENTSIGWNTLANNVNGIFNVAVGSLGLSELQDNAGLSVSNNISVGAGNTIPTGSTSFDNNIILGTKATAFLTGPVTANRLIIGSKINASFLAPLIDGDLANSVLTVNNTLKVADLAGTGTRQVSVDASGQLVANNINHIVATKDVTSNYTIQNGDHYIFATFNNPTITLPDARTNTGRQIVIWGTSTVLSAPSTTQIVINGYGSPTASTTAGTGTFSLTFVSNGTAWIRVI